MFTFEIFCNMCGQADKEIITGVLLSALVHADVFLRAVT
jgi:hypothetical protein